MRRLTPDPGPTSTADQLGTYRPWDDAPPDRPHVAVNFATTVDGRATINGVSGPIGSSTDTEMLVGLRTRFDAVMIGAGTMRAERYGLIEFGPAVLEQRRREGLEPAPLMAIVSGRLDLPWDAPLFTAGGGPVVLFTSSDAEPPETETELEVVRHEGFVSVVEALAHLRRERGIRALLCEGGPGLHNQLAGAGFVDDLFLTIAPKLAGGGGPRIIEGDLPEVIGLEIGWLLEQEGELFVRYRRR